MISNDSIKILGFAKFQAFLFGLLGFLAAVFYSFGGLIYDLITTGTVNIGTALAFLALIGMPVIFSGIGFIIGIVEIIMYKLYVKYFGSIDY